jgi:RNA-directed DNA polymerase
LGNLSTPASVQKLQMALHAKAKAEPSFRFYALYDKIYREDIPAHAWAQCRSNKGAPGVDGKDFADVERYGVERWLGELALVLKDEKYQPDPIRRVLIPKANGKLRPLGISTLRDRVCMTAAMLVLDPIFEADLPPEQYAYRQGRNAQQAVIEVEETLFFGHREVVDADLADYLDRASQCPQVHDGRLKRSGCWTTALILRPFCRPRRMITASNSPRFTRCKTVWRDTPSRCVATCIAT